MSDTGLYGPSALATPANLVTVTRMLLALPFLLVVAAEGASFVTFGVWMLLAGSDGVDGVLARRHGTTRSGAFLDPLADKVLVVGAAWALVVEGSFWWLPVAVITLREMGISVVRFSYARLGLAVPARGWAKVKTFVQSAAVGFALLPSVEGTPWVAATVLWIAVLLTVVTGVNYVLDGRRALSVTGERTI